MSKEIEERILNLMNQNKEKWFYRDEIVYLLLKENEYPPTLRNIVDRTLINMRLNKLVEFKFKILLIQYRINPHI